MTSECCECDRPAAAYWGMLAYCRAHLEIQQRTAPMAHRCPFCRRPQPANVAWRGEACGECKMRESAKISDINQARRQQ